MMKIAIAGSGGLARIFAQYLRETEHITIILSRTAQPDFEDLDCQVVVVDYRNQQDLEYYLRGVDIVISTVSGASQINLIDAAAHSRVSRFIPAEFEGSPSRRRSSDPDVRGKRESLARLKEWNSDSRHRMRYTIFTCGVFYERFARGGLASLGIGANSGIQYQGDYIMNLGTGTAETVVQTSTGDPVEFCMISVWDLAQYVVKAIDLGVETWPTEYRVQGDRRSVSEILQWGAIVLNLDHLDTIYHQAGNLQAHVDHARATFDWGKVARFEELVATEKGRYCFSAPTLTLASVNPIPFWNWLQREWGS
ncbi:NAD(P)-binding Rossmann-fold containing protein [Glarea lozoyensis ATCC 20868]|uniref:NAD(P)-binding Rossmann-fold containing protein n=1 Tax=Glarea lozoyensis (strain ATCC 20868 / MF5171) TaxID=1116229 RepID=S3CNH8_GLAL2|nr:NAD(P)-binding Rossmann-fold containing protein [Glarea lozoyensis ATCC 20868]EPE27265.1 NAD(P)-binding Rossmann-fold containing protein [Glarea lozoyensis ATCC 20868]